MARTQRLVPLPAFFCSVVHLAVAFALPCWLCAAPNDSGNDAQNDIRDTPLTSEPPIARWTFDAPEPGTWRGEQRIATEGPRPPMFPAFAAANKAALFGVGTSLVVRESDLPDVNLRFTAGDALTLEAWVNPVRIADGAYCYIVGKGRHKRAEFLTENQNYALRLKGAGGEARPTFLFRTASEKYNSERDYHRWTANEGFVPGTGWHHVALTYTFGKADSLKAFVDGVEVAGAWDMGGKTDLPPVTDADDLVIGTGNGGGPGNTLQGWLDEVAIYREALPDAVLAQRFQFVPPPVIVDVASLPVDEVRVEICEEGVPVRNAWPPLPPQATETFHVPAFGLVDVPHKYVDTGVRGDRAIPYLLRAAAKISLPAGKHRLLLRSRSAARLQIDGAPVLNLPFAKSDSGGHGLVAEQAGFLDLGPDFRFAPPGTQETWCTLDVSAGEHVVLLETMVGGVLGKSKRRPELGELVVAWSPAGSPSWQLLTPGPSVYAYHDAGWAAYEQQQRAWLEAVDAARRKKQRGEHDEYWNRRRREAAAWLAATPDEPVPPLVDGYPAHNAIDHFIAARLVAVLGQNTSSHAGTVDYFRDIQPIFEARCYGCHRGGKAKGALQLDSRQGALAGGESEGPAIVPGQPDASPLLARLTTDDAATRMPPTGQPLPPEQIARLKTWIAEGAHWPAFKLDRATLTPLADDLAFLRRATLDTVGVVPSLEEITAFLKDAPQERRARAIERLLADPRWADHWVGYWQDVLAENPNMLNPTLNNTGPFRWWIYESLVDNKPLDLFVTELVRMRGSERFGGPRGFGIASQNDAPLAAKGTIISTAFLGVEMKCARCHDAPAHRSRQQDLFELAAMLNAQPLTVPATSSVSAEKLHEGGRKPLIEVTLKTGTKLEPKWPFGEFCPEAVGETLADDPADPRDRLAALLTSPRNERFAQVAANRVWKRFMGRGLVEPVDDWERGQPSHPELLRWLAREFVRGGYDVKILAHLIMSSHAYQRAVDPALRAPSPLFAAPAPRRLGAEQIVDSLFVATGVPFRLEEVSLDIDGRRDVANSISLGQPRRAWMLTSTSNERDRPSLNLPRIQAVTDVLAAFGWRGARQDPTSERDTAPNALQPAILSNGTMGIWLTRLNDEHGVTAMALESQPLETLLDQLYLRLLTRYPSADERARFVAYLAPGYEARVVDPPPAQPASKAPRQPEKFVSWSNHLDPEATLVRHEQELAARRGDPPTLRLAADWRGRMEDVLWAMLNAPEWVFSP